MSVISVAFRGPSALWVRGETYQSMSMACCKALTMFRSRADFSEGRMNQGCLIGNVGK